jgi:hypothetical protein
MVTSRIHLKTLPRGPQFDPWQHIHSKDERVQREGIEAEDER